MEQVSPIELPTGKIYKDRAVWVGTFLGGPLVAGYLIAENFKTFGETQKAKNTRMYAIIATIVIVGGIFFIPEDVYVPNQVIPLMYTVIAYYLVQHLQGKQISAHISAGGKLHNWGRTIAAAIIGLVITVIPVVVFALLSEN